MNEVRKLIDLLNHYREKYYAESISEISDEEYDKLYDKLQKIEKDTGIIYADSPTQSVGWQVLSKLNKVEHNHLMLSLQKTKDVNDVINFLRKEENEPYLAMCKMDGLTCSLRYVNGKLVSAETRGDGKIGEDILHNALTVKSIPYEIPYTEELVIDGEIICTYSNFEKFSTNYKNPRNFASGSIRLLDANECKNRNLTFIVWDVIKGFNEKKSLCACFHTLFTFGFTIVPLIFSTLPSKDANNQIETNIQQIKTLAQKGDYPIDGVVIKFNNRQLLNKLGSTSHHFNNAIAFKFYDELFETSLKSIDWTMGRTGILTPVAIFEPVDIDGTIVERASLHNVSIMEEILGTPYYGQKIQIFKANMIIPQIKSAEKYSYGEIIAKGGAPIPVLEQCPCCKSNSVDIEWTDSSHSTKIMKCTNPLCNGKLLNQLDHFCGKKGFDIKGLSKATLEKLINWDWVSNFEDIIKLSNHKEEWQKKAGFGIKSVNNILDSIQSAISNIELWRVISAAGIPLVGTTAAKTLEKHFKTWESFRKAVDEKFDFTLLDDFGEALHNSILNYNYSEIDKIINSLQFKEIDKDMNNKNSLNDITVVITGKLIKFKNRDALKQKIEEYGGKVVNSISGKTNYLINNDINSTSAKNLTAKSKNVPIISEEDFVNKFFI